MYLIMKYVNYVNLLECSLTYPGMVIVMQFSKFNRIIIVFLEVFYGPAWSIWYWTFHSRIFHWLTIYNEININVLLQVHFWVNIWYAGYEIILCEKIWNVNSWQIWWIESHLRILPVNFLVAIHAAHLPIFYLPFDLIIPFINVIPFQIFLFAFYGAFIDGV